MYHLMIQKHKLFLMMCIFLSMFACISDKLLLGRGYEICLTSRLYRPTRSLITISRHPKLSKFWMSERVHKSSEICKNVWFGCIKNRIWIHWNGMSFHYILSVRTENTYSICWCLLKSETTRVVYNSKLVYEA